MSKCLYKIKDKKTNKIMQKNSMVSIDNNWNKVNVISKINKNFKIINKFDSFTKWLIFNKQQHGRNKWKVIKLFQNAKQYYQIKSHSLDSFKVKKHYM